MRKKMIAFLSAGVFGILLSVGWLVLERANRLAGLPFAFRIVPVFIMGISAALISMAIASRGGTLIRDEMVVRVEQISGYYAFKATAFFVCLLGIVHFFANLTFSISGLLLTMLLFMGFSNRLIRYSLMRRGKAE